MSEFHHRGTENTEFREHGGALLVRKTLCTFLHCVLCVSVVNYYIKVASLTQLAEKPYTAGWLALLSLLSSLSRMPGYFSSIFLL